VFALALPGRALAQTAAPAPHAAEHHAFTIENADRGSATTSRNHERKTNDVFRVSRFRGDASAVPLNVATEGTAEAVIDGTAKAVPYVRHVECTAYVACRAPHQPCL
jgi:hypothetical protein